MKHFRFFAVAAFVFAAATSSATAEHRGDKSEGKAPCTPLAESLGYCEN